MGETSDTNIDVTTGAEPNATDKKPTVEDLLKQLAAEQATNKRYKDALDKATSEAAENKKKLKAKMTADEQAQAEALERQRQTETELAELRRAVALTETSKRFMGLSMDEATATKAAEALIDSENDALFSILEAHIQAVKTGEEQKFLMNRPNIPAGNGTAQTVTKEQFRKMDYNEMRKLRQDNPSLFAELTK